MAARRLPVALRQDAMRVTRVAVGKAKLVYVIVADKKLSYPEGRSNMAYVGDHDGVSRVAQSPLPEPRGTSGGGLWYFDPTGATDPTAVWSPHKHLRLIGVQTSWDVEAGHVTVDPVHRWADWFADAVHRLDKHLTGESR